MGFRTMPRMGLALAAMLFVSACATQGADRFQQAEAGQVIETAPARVLSSREVEIQGNNSSVGAIAGGATGAAAAGLGTGSGLAAVLAGIAGAGLGALAENQLRRGDGREYIVQMSDGRTVTIVQNVDENDQPIADGTPVLIQFGPTYTRVIPHPEGLPAPPPSASAPAGGGTFGTAGGSGGGGSFGGAPTSGGANTGGAPGGGAWQNPDATGGTGSGETFTAGNGGGSVPNGEPAPIFQPSTGGGQGVQQ